MSGQVKIFDELERLSHLVPVAFYWVAVDTTIIGGNKIALEMIKEISSICSTSPYRNVIGKNAFDIFPFDIAQELVNNNKKTIEANKPLVFEETIADVKYSNKKFRVVLRSPLYEDGDVVGILVLVNDLAEFREKITLDLEKQLRFKQLVDQTAYEFKSPLSILLLLVHQCSELSKDAVFDILSRLTELTPTLLYWFDEKNILLISNKWDSEAVGGNFVGKTPYDYFPFSIANDVVEHNKEVMKSGKIFSYDELLKNASTGELNYFRAFKAPLYDNRGKSIGVLGTSVNITTEKNAEHLKLENEVQRMKLEEQKKYEIMITRLAHDIRSPTASLSTIIDTCKNIPEKERIILTHVANRITDIANNLLESYKKNNSKEMYADDMYEQREVLVSLALSSIVSEKREQYNNSSVILKNCFNSSSEFLFIKANLSNFSRTISNLIDNSFEAISDKEGEICVALSQENEYVKITIRDSGKGMSQDVIDKIMNDVAVTVGKRDGYGIGFVQVRETLKMSGGKIAIESVVGKGTSIMLFFPIINEPNWIAKQISLLEGSVVIVLDDDLSIHGAWDIHFKNYKGRIHLEHFKFGKEVIDFVTTFPEKNKLFLLADFELIDQNMNGLQVIDQISMTKQSILVTSYYNKPQVLELADKYGVKILPKQLASFIPVEIDGDIIQSSTNDLEKIDLVIIDDYKVFADSLSMFFEAKSLNVDVYYNPRSFLQNLSKYHKNIKICIDHGFRGEVMTGIDLAVELYEAGYSKLYLLSGKDFDEHQVPGYLTVITKGRIEELNKLMFG